LIPSTTMQQQQQQQQIEQSLAPEMLTMARSQSADLALRGSGGPASASGSGSSSRLPSRGSRGNGGTNNNPNTDGSNSIPVMEVPPHMHMTVHQRVLSPMTTTDTAGGGGRNSSSSSGSGSGSSRPPVNSTTAALLQEGEQLATANRGISSGARPRRTGTPNSRYRGSDTGDTGANHHEGEGSLAPEFAGMMATGGISSNYGDAGDAGGAPVPTVETAALRFRREKKDRMARIAKNNALSQGLLGASPLSPLAVRSDQHNNSNNNVLPTRSAAAAAAGSGGGKGSLAKVGAQRRRQQVAALQQQREHDEGLNLATTALRGWSGVTSLPSHHLQPGVGIARSRLQDGWAADILGRR
jgi:hypothetical protein